MAKKSIKKEENNQEQSEKDYIPFWENIFNKIKKFNYENINLLEQIPLFDLLSKKEIKKVSLLIYERKYLKNEFLFKEDNPAAGMFIIKSGAISIERKSESGEPGHLATLTEGDFVGELALLNDSPRSASARCINNTTVIVFFRQDLFNLIDREPALGSKILKELAIMIGERLKETNKTLLKHKYALNKYRYKSDSKK
jgi:CRP/FNR family transcriptional regulator, cyclic AMP receptor protein